jgi:cytochrome c oxidase subunit II
MMSWLPKNISTFGGDIDHLFAVVYYIVGAWFIAAEALLFWFMLRYRRRRGEQAAYVRGDRVGQLAWVLVPSVIVLGLDLMIDGWSAPVWARIKQHLPSDGMQVIAQAKQFNWSFIYPGPDGKLETADDVKIDNELHVPVNENVTVLLRSEDVMHSFFIPTARLKQDVLPGRTIKAWFNATETGRYELPCAELCGFGHYTMRGFLDVHTPEDYKAWAAKTLAPPAQ